MAYGTESHVRVARQNSGGTATTATGSFHSIPIISESLVTTVPSIISDTIRARYEEGPAIQGIIGVQGDLVFRPNPVQMAMFFYALTGVISSTALNSAWQHIFVPVQTRFDPALALPPYTIEKYPSVGSAHQYMDAQLNRLTIECAAGQLLRCTANWIARTSSLMVKTTPTFPTGVEWAWNQVSLALRSAANTDWEQFTITFDNALQPFPTLDGTRTNFRIQRNGYRTIRVTGVADFPDGDEFDQFFAGSEYPLDVTLKGLSISSGNIETMRIAIPNFRYTAYPIAISGPNRLTVAFDGTAIYNVGSGYAALLTVVNTGINF